VPDGPREVSVDDIIECRCRDRLHPPFPGGIAAIGYLTKENLRSAASFIDGYYPKLPYAEFALPFVTRSVAKNELRLATGIEFETESSDFCVPTAPDRQLPDTSVCKSKFPLLGRSHRVFPKMRQLIVLQR
jgi:hypothetical protein